MIITIGNYPAAVDLFLLNICSKCTYAFKGLEPLRHYQQ